MITLSWVSLIVFFNLFYQFLLFLLISSVCTHAPLYTCIHKHTHTQMKNLSAQSSQTASLTYPHLLYITCMRSRHLKSNKLSTMPLVFLHEPVSPAFFLNLVNANSILPGLEAPLWHCYRHIFVSHTPHQIV